MKVSSFKQNFLGGFVVRGSWLVAADGWQAALWDGPYGAVCDLRTAVCELRSAGRPWGGPYSIFTTIGSVRNLWKSQRWTSSSRL